MKNILYLSFYFEPDLSAGSFRNTALSKELASQLDGKANVHVITTQPNRYKSFKEKATAHEEKGNLIIDRIEVPEHKSGLLDQLYSYRAYFRGIKKITKNKKYDLVFVSSSRLFSSYIGRIVANKNKCPLYLDIRDLFVDNMKELIRRPAIKYPLNIFLKIIERLAFSRANHINLVSEGFKENFTAYKQAAYTYYPNGIDDVFLSLKQAADIAASPKTILYAGNIGEGQGLEKIIPDLAEAMGSDYRIKIFGDGGTKNKLLNRLEALDLQNVELHNPVKRDTLLDQYSHAHFLFLHLNDFEAFKKVLPSKLFEYGATNIPVIAGVGGYAASFVQQYIPNAILFEPCNSKQAVSLLQQYHYHLEERNQFVEQFKRANITKALASSIGSYLPN